MTRAILPHVIFLLRLVSLCRADDRAEIEALMHKMETAALAADPAAWLANIDPANHFFYIEQTKWSSDLKDHKPAEFSLAVADGEPQPLFTADDAQVTLTMRWRLDEVPADAPRAVQKITFPAEFHKRGGVWKYAGEHLEQIEGDGFIVRFPPGYEKVARDIAAVFPEARDHVNKGFEVHPARIEHIKLYDSQRVLQASVYLSMYKTDTTLSGWNEWGESIKFLTNYTGTRDGWKKAFAHEYGHVATWEYGPHAVDMPWWVQEGVAELAAEDFPPLDREKIDDMMKERAAKGTLADWKVLADYRTCPKPLRMLPYYQGHAMLGYISEKWGRKGRIAWLKAMAQGASLEDATQKELGVTFEELDKQWHATLK